MRISGIPNRLRQVPLIKEFLRVVGKVVVVDELSIVRPNMGGLRGAPVRAKIWCRDPTKVSGLFKKFRGLSGFMMWVD